MASNRHLGRIVALQTLYEEDFRRECQDPNLKLEEILTRNVSRYQEVVDDRDFIRELVVGTDKNRQKIDEIIQPVAPEWPIDQIARMDRVILRMGVFELNFANTAPPKVVINEAVELAKSFGGDNSSKFVNGVLGTVLRNSESTKAKKPKSTKTKANPKKK